jgi:hypothetical protein
MVEVSSSQLGRLAAVAIAGLGIASCSTTSSTPSPTAASTPSATAAPKTSSSSYFDAFKQKPPEKVMLIESNPGGVQAKASFGKTCTTPCTMLVSEPGDFTVTFTQAGYVPQTLTVHVNVEPAGWTTGPSLVFDPPSLFPTLEKSAPPAVARKGAKPPA